MAGDRLPSGLYERLFWRKLTLKPDESAAISDPERTPKLVMPAKAGIHYKAAIVVPGLRPADYSSSFAMDSGFRRNDGNVPNPALHFGLLSDS